MFFLFFFQAEDGIRDHCVTGVQTCALPILKIGGEYSSISSPGSGNLLPLHFGGRYLFSAIPALGVTSALDGLKQAIPAAYVQGDRKSTRLNSSHTVISYAVFCLKKKITQNQ